MSASDDGRTGRTTAAHTVGVIGWPVAHSLSPAIHNAAFADLGMRWTYVPLPVEPGRLPAALDGLVALGFAGANVTMPHKSEAAGLCDVVSEDATRLGAANTLVVRGWGTPRPQHRCPGVRPVPAPGRGVRSGRPHRPRVRGRGSGARGRPRPGDRRARVARRGLARSVEGCGAPAGARGPPDRGADDPGERRPRGRRRPRGERDPARASTASGSRSRRWAPGGSWSTCSTTPPSHR